jgi:hypothetical protein
MPRVEEQRNAQTDSTSKAIELFAITTTSDNSTNENHRCKTLDIDARRSAA